MERLEQPHMEDIMKPGSVRKLKVVGHLPDVLEDLERPHKTWPELPLGPGLKCAGSVDGDGGATPNPPPRT